jgi:MFS family permease
MTSSPSGPEPGPWYRGITAYQWLVLLLASAGWIFDVYEGQIYNLTRDPLLKDILPLGSDQVFHYRGDLSPGVFLVGGSGAVSSYRMLSQQEAIFYYGDIFLGVFLIGGALGGILFGSLADRWGRRPTLVATILVYSLFSGLTFYAHELWQVGVLRFLVAMGVGGEWSVAAALVAEIFPTRARAYAGSIFHSSSILGTVLAGLAALEVGSEWRYVYLLGVLSALLIVAVRAGVSEPKTWIHAGGSSAGSLWELLADRRWAKRALLGLLLATVGLGTFWAVTVAGQDLAKRMLLRQGVASDEAGKYAQIAYGFVETAGGGLGLLSFGPLAVRWGRRRTFIFFHLAALVIVPLTCYAPAEYWQLLALLPLYGFFTLGMHAGYAIYFPELFPTRLRATGAGFCFNGGRLVAASVLVFSGWLKSLPDMHDIRLPVTLLSGLFLFGVLFVWLLPETKGQPLPE